MRKGEIGPSCCKRAETLPGRTVPDGVHDIWRRIVVVRFVNKIFDSWSGKKEFEPGIEIPSAVQPTWYTAGTTSSGSGCPEFGTTRLTASCLLPTTNLRNMVQRVYCIAFRTANRSNNLWIERKCCDGSTHIVWDQWCL